MNVNNIAHMYRLITNMVKKELMSSFLFLLLSAGVSKAAYTIHIDPELGHDSSTCLDGKNGFCATLGYAVHTYGTNNSVIVLANGTHLVNDTIYIRDVNNVTLIGKKVNVTETMGVMIRCSAESGLKFVRVTSLRISGIQIENCGAFADSTTRFNQTSMAIFRAAVYVLNSTNISIESSAFVNNRGVGLVLFDVNGHVSVQDSNFTNNFVPEDEKMIYNGGGGIYIEHTYCTPGLVHCDFQTNPYSNDSLYAISRCNFISNHATTPPEQSSSEFVHQLETESKHFGSGGGLQIILKGISSGNKFIISSCTFENNSAEFGGGVNVNIFQDYIRDEFHFESCNMLNNNAHFGGGAISVGLLFYETHSIFYSLVSFRHANFTRNSAQSGAGVYFFSSRIKSSEINATRILFSDCKWYQNHGTLGAALILAPDAFVTLTDGYLPVPEFSNCLFESNKIIPIYEENNVLKPAVGVLFSSTFTMNFHSSIIFVGNNGTAISITAGSINILKDASVEFKNNTGVRGGALALLEYASVRIYSGSKISFISNYASELGGAIYASAQDELDFLFSRSCFLHYEDVTVPAKLWNVSVKFENNSAGSLSSIDVEDSRSISPLSEPGDIEHAWGSSIFSVTILPCIRALNTKIFTVDRFLNNTLLREHGGSLTFNESCSNSLCHPSIATAPAAIQISPDQLDPNGVLRLSPGENRNISLIARDDLSNIVPAVVTASVFPSDVATVDSASLYITDSMVQINGKMHSTFTLTLHTIGRRQISTHVQALFIDCPPGFVYQAQKWKCVCSATTQTQQYLGITRCDAESFRSLLSKRYWAGCNTSDSLLTAVCPGGYCRYYNHHDDVSNPFFILPHSCQKLEEYLCGPRQRKGRLCGECANNYTVFFHSAEYSCKECKYDYLGWLFYILSELLPVTLVFLAVMLLNVHLTAGLWNSIILYAQIIDFIGTRSLQSSELPRGLSTLSSFYRLIYGSFNLDFFKFEDTLSFCLWDGATVMDVLVFRYLTAAYAILLLLILLLSFKSPCWSKCQSAWERGQAAMGRSHHKDLVIHGISAFLVLSYAFCVKVSFQLLIAVQLYGQGHTPAKRVVMLSGNIEYLSVDHLPYAIPAIFILILTTLPPIILIGYPNGLQAISSFIGESRMEKFNDYSCCNKPACRIIQMAFRISRFKPLFDSFQGCFKDRYRFFAGMFFLYRFIISLVSAVTTDVLAFYATLEILSVFMLAIHAFAQPYQRQLYNYLDTFMFANLAVVNALYLYNDYNSSASRETKTIIASSFQLIFIYLPLIFITVLWVLFGVTGCSKQARRNLQKINQHVPLFKPRADEEEAISEACTETPFDQDHLPHRMFDENADDQIENHHNENTTQGNSNREQL